MTLIRTYVGTGRFPGFQLSALVSAENIVQQIDTLCDPQTMETFGNNSCDMLLLVVV